MKSLQDLQVWRKSHELTLAIYVATKEFPRDELFGVTSQIRRACASIPANIAEGCGRNSDNELRRFLEIAMGSASELEYHLLLSKDLSYISDSKHTQLNESTCEVKRMLSGFIQKLKADR